MSSIPKIDQQTTDKIYHVYKEKDVVAHNISKEDLDLIYDPEEHEYEELEPHKYYDASF
ncbi:hypothetical protein S-PM2d137 [Synechococcus phage S-PM2]|uniref:Hypothetical-Protein / belonging to T4-LIKE GC: 840 n=1 Tax=Synechococcus phage S-PM2 TaxID=238854 RepID=Q5GQK0_BPSYP|nr:Hypothetical-Protein / belonging to T4-LIKE GC: 840 [Synechococcus phage S-PM2]CAF34202.1 Hypothetical-Protein / belonging to T4-LIKE GC: 840 [Synechococcus phage S-PM2]CFW42324.1 hypothetical protein S-PM2d137 [Synechococcus phage S-PM2]